MRKQFTRIIGLLLLTSIYTLSFAQNTYEKGIGAANLDNAYAVTILNNSTYITGANGSFTDQASSSIQVLKLDATGNKVWDISIQGGLTQFAVNWSTSITALSTNQLLVGGYTDDGTLFGNKDGFVNKLDTNGNVLWSKRYGTTGQDRIFSVLEMHNGEYIVAGYQVVSSSGGGSDGIFIIRIDTAGNVVWNKYFSESPTTAGLAFLNGAIITNNDEIVATGFTNTFGSGDYDYFLIKLDANGNTIFYKNYGDAVDNRMYAITELNNEYFLAGKSGNNNCLMKVDSSGNILWTNYYTITGASINDFRAVTNDGTSIIAAGKTDLSGGEAIIVKINPSTGAAEGGATYGGNALDKFYGISAYGNSIVGVGSTTSTDVAPSTNGDMFVVKTSTYDLSSCSGALATVVETPVTYTTTNPTFPLGTNSYTAYSVNEVLISTNFLTTQTCSSIVTNTNKEISDEINIKVFPNPVSNILKVNYALINNNKFILNVFNVYGQEVLHINKMKNIGNFTETIDVNQLKNGIYFVKLQIGNLTESKKIIIER